MTWNSHRIRCNLDQTATKSSCDEKWHGISMRIHVTFFTGKTKLFPILNLHGLDVRAHSRTGPMGDRASPEGPSVLVGPWAFVLQKCYWKKAVFVAKIDCKFILFLRRPHEKIARFARSLFSYSKGKLALPNYKCLCWPNTIQIKRTN